MTTNRRPPRSGTRQHPPLRVRVQISAIAKGGEGIAHAEIDGRTRAVLVTRTVPGDVVEVSVRMAGGTLRGEPISIVTPSPDRVDPPCPSWERCGGCDLMHASLDAQRQARLQIVRDAIDRDLSSGLAIELHPASSVERYRTRIRLAAEARRGRCLVGFRAWHSHDLVQVDRCLVATEELDRAQHSLGPWLARSDGRGDVTLSTGVQRRPAIHLTWSGTLSPSVYAEAEARTRSGEWAGVLIATEGSSIPAVVGDPRSVSTALDGEPLYAPAGGFMQASDAMNLELARAVVKVAECGGRKVLELFAGSGNFTVGLARETDALETVENERDAVDCARANLGARGLSAKLRCADADSCEIRDDVRVVVLDPPRSGAPGASARVAKSRARRVVMVSCDPATLARDLRMLTADGVFAMASIDIFEMFPMTSHIETVVVLERVKGH